MGAPRVTTLATAATYGVALGVSTLVLPLLALEHGHSAGRIGWFAASGALAQLVARLFMGALLRRFPDRVLVALSMVTLLGSFGMVWGSRGVGAFLAAMALQGLSRACFWTGIQTHAVHAQEAVGSSLARVTVAGNAGLVVGPVLAGFCLARSPALALTAGMAVSVIALGFSLCLTRWPPFSPPVDASQGRVWRRPAVLTGAVGTGVAGCWRGLLGSYVPAVLVAAGQSSTDVGVAVALGSAANAVAALVLIRWQPVGPATVVALSCLGAGLGVGLLGVVAEWAVAVAVCLVVSGYGAGLLQVVGSAIAVEGVHPEERGEALAVTGLVRSGTTMLAPVVVAAMLPLMPLSAAVAVVGVVLAGPAAGVRRWRGR